MLTQPINTMPSDDFHFQFGQTIQKLEDSMYSSFQILSQHKRVWLLKVYANTHSPLTEAVERLGYRAIRFTKQDGDLATFAGRHKLWSWIEKYQPEHIWMAPECGSWGGWNHLNKLKSPILFDQIQAKQDQQLPHVRLCARVCQFQVNRGSHFHLEQPAGSGLVHLKVFESVLQRTVSARFDMCKFGLRIPKTNRFLRKRSQILTTSKALFYAVHGSRCADQHIHQRMEGSANINGTRQSLTNFCATYCGGFADMMACNWCKAYHTHVGDDERALAFHSDDVEERPSKRLRINPRSRKRHQTESETPGENISARPSVPMSDVPTPNVGDPNPSQTDAQLVQLEIHCAKSWQCQMSHGFRGMDKSPNHCPRSYADHRHVRLQRHRKISSSTSRTKFSSMSSAPHCVYA